MVSRKQVGQPLAVDSAQADPTGAAQPMPPYPTTPTNERAEPAPQDQTHVHESDGFDLIDIKEELQRTRSDSDASHGTWDTDSEDEDSSAKREDVNEADIPQPLRITPSKQNIKTPPEPKPMADGLPAILRPGPATGMPLGSASAANQYAEEAQANPWASSGQSTPQRPPVTASLDSNNPYRQQNGQEPPNSQTVWDGVKPALPSAAPPPPPVELPVAHTPMDELQTIPWESTRPGGAQVSKTAGVLPVPQAKQASEQSYDQSGETFPSSNPWSQEAKPIPALPAEPSRAPLPGSNEFSQQALQDSLNDGQAPSLEGNTAQQPPTQANPWHTASAISRPSVAQIEEQRNETYSIKHVNWLDASKPGLRRSPILTQNANGPCPLLALVNALVLSTPHNANTGLIDVLQSRETISLGLLLDAVFDELMSGRRESGPHGLPDVDELYAFLLALHTGMNVNPRFTPSPTGSSQNISWYFEETREMRLYSTFNILLIHGWIAGDGTPEYAAFQRSAQTFEDAQNIQFAESELIDKQRHDRLDFQEDQMLQDIQTIKHFLNIWPTQLTERGLDNISRTLSPGQIAILFRNDHFSTLYKEPTHGALMTLITDAGYSTHEEIVWESLVDVNGAASEMFSGDFRVVSHNGGSSLGQNSSGGGNEGWETVAGRGHGSGRASGGQFHGARSEEAAPPLPGPRPHANATQGALDVNDVTDTTAAAAQRSAREQEDHDLALALQLQEEEEDRQRQADDRRRREQRLSEQFLSNEGEGTRPPIPPRRSNTNLANAAGRNSRPSGGRGPSGRPAVSRPSDNPADPEAPPSYEQAASDRPYRPVGATAPDMQGNPLNTYDALMAQQAPGYGSPSPALPGRPGGRRRNDSRLNPPNQIPGGYASSSTSLPPGRVPGAAAVKDAEDKCIIM